MKIKIITHAVQPKKLISSREANEQSKLQREANLCIDGRATALQSLFLCLHGGISVSGEITVLSAIVNTTTLFFSLSLSHLEIV